MPGAIAQLGAREVVSHASLGEMLVVHLERGVAPEAFQIGEQAIDGRGENGAR